MTLLGLSEKVGGYDLARLGRAKRPVKKPLHSLRRQVMNKGCEEERDRLEKHWQVGRGM